MARKVLRHTVLHENRDAGKVFVITEMPASQAQKWGLRAFLGLARNGVEVPPDLEGMGMVGMLQYGIEMIGKLPFEEADVLCDELLSCVQIQPDPAKPAVVRPLMEQDIEEVSTRLELLRETFKLHVNFSSLAKNSTPESGVSVSTTSG